MKRNKRLQFTSADREEFKQKRLASRAKLSLAYQLGFYVGEQIVSRYLPTLSCDSIRTRTVIQVSQDEADESKLLSDIWFNKRMAIRGGEEEKTLSSETEWQALRDYQEMLEAKYLPNTLECMFDLLNVTEEHMVEFKKGISVSLWDCDCSNYSVDVEKIRVVADEDGWFTTITLIRG